MMRASGALGVRDDHVDSASLAQFEVRVRVPVAYVGMSWRPPGSEVPLMVLKVPVRVPTLTTWKALPVAGTKPFVRVTFSVPFMLAVLLPPPSLVY